MSIKSLKEGGSTKGRLGYQIAEKPKLFYARRLARRPVLQPEPDTESSSHNQGRSHGKTPRLLDPPRARHKSPSANLSASSALWPRQPAAERLHPPARSSRTDPEV